MRRLLKAGLFNFERRTLMKIALATAVRVVTSNGSKVKAIGGGN
jgi:hypothetical protein